MTPETKERLDAVLKRLNAFAAKAAQPPGATNGTMTANPAATVAVEQIGKTVTAAPDAERRIAALEKTIRDWEQNTRHRTVGGGGTSKYVFKSAEENDGGANLGIDGKRFSIVKALLAKQDARTFDSPAWDRLGAGYEREALKAYYAAKNMSYGDEPSGGFLVPAEVRATIDVLRSSTFLDKLPVQRFSGLTYAPVEMPRQTSDQTSYWLGELVTLTLSDQAYDMIKLNPNKMGCGTRLSNTLLRKAPGVAETRVRTGIAASMTRKLELGVIEGTGASGQPLGLNNVTGINTRAFTSKDADEKLGLLRSMIADLNEDNVGLDGRAWLMSELAWQNILGIQVQLSAATPAANLTPSVPLYGIAYVDAVSKQRMLFDLPVVTTTNLTASTTTIISLARWPEVMVADWGAGELSMTTEGSTLKLIDAALIVGYMEADVQIEHPVAYCSGTAYTYAATV